MLIPVAGTTTGYLHRAVTQSVVTLPPDNTTLLIDSQTYSETYSEIIHTTTLLLLHTTDYSKH